MTQPSPPSPPPLFVQSTFSSQVVEGHLSMSGCSSCSVCSLKKKVFLQYGFLSDLYLCYLASMTWNNDHKKKVFLQYGFLSDVHLYKENVSLQFGLFAEFSGSKTWNNVHKKKVFLLYGFSSGTSNCFRYKKTWDKKKVFLQYEFFCAS